MRSRRTELPENTLRLIPLTPAVFFCLFALADGAKHGYAMMQETTRLSSGKVRMGPGTLYSTIQRLLELDLIEETGSMPGDGPAVAERRRYYQLTDRGKALLKCEIERMQELLNLAAGMVLCRP
jgi:DNA-binding PadR family transcriptional regulator